MIGLTRFRYLGAVALLALTACNMPPAGQQAYGPPPAPASDETAPPVALTADAESAPPAATVQTTKTVVTKTASMPESQAMDDRVARLEKQLVEIRNDMNMMMPALTRLVSAQQDLQQILSRMETSSGTPAAAVIEDTNTDRASLPGAPKSPVAPSTEIEQPGDKPAEIGRDANEPMKPEAQAEPRAQTLYRADDTAPSPAMIAAADAPVPLINPQPMAAATEAAGAGLGDSAPPEGAPPVGAHAEAAKPLSHDDVPPPVAMTTTTTTETKTESASAPPAEPIMPEGVVPPEPAVPASYMVSQIRFGEHANMTRVVLDASGKVPYTYALDTTGTLMTLHLPQTSWRTVARSVPAGSKVVDSYMATPDGQGGYMVTVKLKQPVNVSWSDVLPPSAEGGYRVVLDLTPKV